MNAIDALKCLIEAYGTHTARNMCFVRFALSSDVACRRGVQVGPDNPGSNRARHASWPDAFAACAYLCGSSTADAVQYACSHRSECCFCQDTVDICSPTSASGLRIRDELYNSSSSGTAAIASDSSGRTWSRQRNADRLAASQVPPVLARSR